MSILNDCTTIGELVERAEHLKPSQRGRLGDVQAVEGQPGQRQGVREHHQVNTRKEQAWSLLSMFFIAQVQLTQSCSEYS